MTPKLLKVCTPNPQPPAIPESLGQTARFLKALGDQRRLSLIWLIDTSPQESVCVCDLVAAMDVQQSTVSHHLKILVDAGILVREQRGTWAYYCLAPTAQSFIRTLWTQGEKNMTQTPAILFICNSNKGKSQMAAALLEHEAPGRFIVTSAGVKAAIGQAVNEQASESLAAIGADMSQGRPRQLTKEAMQSADRVIVVGGAQIPDAEGTQIERWAIAEPPESGIEGTARMNLIRDEIRARVQQLVAEF